jgi:ubiquinone/menaquinone biosynthesis C-methylase UbiE
MPIPEARLKEEITRRWDESSETYDTHAGHGIKSDEERDAWREAFNKTIPSGAVYVLDVGCGTGELSFLMAEMGYRVTGLDLSQKMLNKARAKAGASGLDIRFETGDAESPPFEINSFDCIFARHLLWTLPHPQKALVSWKGILRDGGRVMIVDGVWNDGSLQTKARALASDMAKTLTRMKRPVGGRYTKEIEESLPNSGGTPLERSMGYLKAAGFENIGHIDLLHIREIQRRHMSFCDRIRRHSAYYMVFGDR